jgi:transposase
MKTEILSGPERRRRWSAAEKERIVGEALAPEANMASIARRHGVSRSLIYAWRREAKVEPCAAPALVPVVVAPGEGTDPPSKDHGQPGVRSGSARSRHSVGSGVIEVALAGGARVTLRGSVDLKGLRAVLSVLRG